MSLSTVDCEALELKVKSMYSDVALNPHGEFHFEMGRAHGGAARLCRRRSRRDAAGGHRVVCWRRPLLPPGGASGRGARGRPWQRLGNGQLHRRPSRSGVNGRVSGST